MNHKNAENGHDDDNRMRAHDTGHNHVPETFNRAFAIGSILNLAFVIGEVIFGLSSHSLALLADAGHNLGDVFGLLLSWAASALSRSAPTATRTYRLRSSSILAALFNAILLLIGVGAIAWEAIQRFHAPGAVQGQTVIWVALAGIVVNSAKHFCLCRAGRVI